MRFPTPFLRALRDASGWTWLMIFVSLLGLSLRIEHALTFDQVHRASDYEVHLLGVRWTQQHWQAFFHSPSVNYQVRSYPPLWSDLSFFRPGSRLVRCLADLSLVTAVAECRWGWA